MAKTLLINHQIAIIKTNENIRKIATGKGDDFTTGCLLMFFIIEEAKETVLDFSQGTVKDL